MSQAATSIQIAYVNRFATVWEYEKAFLAGELDLLSYLGPACPICGRQECYRQISPYWRCAIDLYPFRKGRIPIGRFLCRSRGMTVSLLPHQLIPYVQYTMAAVMQTLLTVLEFRQRGQQGFHGASLTVDPDSSVTPWLICCWLAMVLRGLRRAHPVLAGRYDLSGIRSGVDSGWAALELRGYLKAFGLWAPAQAGALATVVTRYSRPSSRFLFGTPSQLRRPRPA